MSIVHSSGVKDFAADAARIRSSGNYRTAAYLEAFTGQRRRFGRAGETLTETTHASLRDVDNYVPILDGEPLDVWGYAEMGPARG